MTEIIELDEKAVELVSGGVDVPGYPSAPPGGNNPLENQSPWKNGIYYQR